MTAGQCRIAGVAFLAVAGICGFYAWSKYDENARAIAAMQENPMARQLASMARGMGGQSGLEPTMPEAGRIALHIGAAMVVGAVASFLMASKARD